jgi:endonuclease/exonuclease/phosphatase family metal-dependent hydrolase
MPLRFLLRFAPLSVTIVLFAFACSSGAGGSPVDAGPADATPVDEPDTSTPADDAGLDGALDAPSEASAPDANVTCSATRLRVVAGNLTGAGATYDDERGIRIFRGLRPDVALVQELRYGDDSPGAQRAFVDAAFGTTFAFVRGRLANGGDIPNAVVSRYPIVDSGEWTDPQVQNRTFVWAKIDVPGPRDLVAVSVHLLTTNARDRELEARALAAEVAKLPAGTLVVLGGDLNTTTRNEAALTELDKAFVTAGPYPVDQAGNANTNTPRSRPYDWVLATPPLDGCRAPVTLGSASFPNGLVFDSRGFTPLADVAPVGATDSDTPLQHMAVVRELTVPE